MASRILDNNRLIRGWHDCRPQSEVEARAAAQRLIALENANAIVTPVKLEFLHGSRSEELPWADAFLAEFNVVDGGRILPEDWIAAERFVRRAGHRRRGIIDSLIRAIADRLNYDVVTNDTGMPPSETQRRRDQKKGRGKRT